MDTTKEIALYAFALGVGLLPWLLDRGGATVPPWMITMGGNLDFLLIGAGIFYFLSGPLHYTLVPVDNKLVSSVIIALLLGAVVHWWTFARGDSKKISRVRRTTFRDVTINEAGTSIGEIVVEGPLNGPEQ